MKRLLLAAALLLTQMARAEEHLVLVGGGQHPPEAMKAFYDWTGREEPRILVVGWASSVPDENLRIVLDDYARYAHPPQLELAARDRETVLQQLERADGVWFTGGDQTKVMQVLKDRALLQALRKKYQDGTVFGGTSAGTAIMSVKMLTGNADLTVIDPATPPCSSAMAPRPAWSAAPRLCSSPPSPGVCACNSTNPVNAFCSSREH